ncbi:MAG: flagellar export protein FliJ [Nitrospira sp.]|nr:flagellar export protein FliJ [Nitrospira sp.]MBH0182608.1 flagellar export protein FliJ [Nitrospira sp.]MBH0186615.1 flagellar export protein FliJ [Nitrospira sp.]MBH0188317.1 flagellar export protein FliJ [Nitrospira sp.]MBH0195328.1 flagellar export protein FliJ [Nitrospira sp.]
MRLDSLRKLRVQTQEALTMELAQVTQELVSMEQRCNALDAQIQSDTSAYRIQAEQGLVIEALWEWLGRLDVQRAALIQARSTVGHLTEMWSSAHARLVEATQERKILDRLLERQREAHDAELNRREQQAMDEAAGRMFQHPARRGVS